MSITRSVAATETPPSVEQVRKQAKRRLIGVAVLVLAAVVVFPLLFDTQPRPVPVDMPIEIPSRKVSKPLQVDAPAVAEQAVAPATAPAPAAVVPVPATASVAATAPVAKPATVAKAEPEEVIIESTPPNGSPSPGKNGAVASGQPSAPVPAPAAPRVAEATSKPVATARPEVAHPVEKKEAAAPKPVQASDKPAATLPAAPSVAATAPVVRKDPGAEAARALALLEGRPAPAPEATGQRFIVQVGAFADAAVAQATRAKLERAGLKTYTHVADLPEGKRTRVRLGPFATRADAEKAAAKAKAQGVSAAILTL